MTENPIYTKTKATLRRTPRTWLITGAAGFIGFHLAQRLLERGDALFSTP